MSPLEQLDARAPSRMGSTAEGCTEIGQVSLTNYKPIIAFNLKGDISLSFQENTLLGAQTSIFWQHYHKSPLRLEFGFVCGWEEELIKNDLNQQIKK